MPQEWGVEVGLDKDSVEGSRSTGLVGVSALLTVCIPVVLFVIGCSAQLAVAQLQKPTGTVGGNAPGMSPNIVAELELPVDRRFGLEHVQAGHFAEALGNDPERIFAFVRDAIAFESYPGALRGPRGTLLALAGNSTDRALLLGAMLEHAGQEVRYARGTLADESARELVHSMWVARPVRELEPEGEASPELQNALDTLLGSVQRDYALIRDHLSAAAFQPAPDAAISLSELVQESRVHTWVHWLRDGVWVDLDPSFADSVVGGNHAQLETTLEELPEEEFHRVEIRIALEESTDGAPSIREVLHYAARAADLSGVDIVLMHMPESWQGPAGSLSDAMASVIEDTGKVKAVLLVPGEVHASEPFSQEPPTTVGLGGIGNLLGGAGSRDPVAIATAESIEFHFISPNGERDIVVRELFDLVGKARRQAEEPLSGDEVDSLTTAEGVVDVTDGVYSFFFSTGRIDPWHLSRVVTTEEDDPGAAQEDGLEILEPLRHLNLAFLTAADGLLPAIQTPAPSPVRFYPDTPRVQITELVLTEQVARLSLDLRRNRARAVSPESSPSEAFMARVFRGVVDGALERSLMEYITADPGGAPSLEMSTSLVFEQAVAQGAATVLIVDDAGLRELVAAPDIVARLGEEVAQGNIAVVPRQSVDISGSPRLAWWRIDPRTGETVAVTDEGLHQVVTEYRVVEDQNTHRVHITERTYLVQRGGSRIFLGQRESTLSPAAFNVWIDNLLRSGVRIGRILGG